MAQRGLADWEISLIKQMMAEGYARDKMHAYFNRPERTLTPAAFSEIKAEKFGSNISASGPEALARFVETFSKSPAAAESDPIGLATLGRLLATDAAGRNLIETENDHIEFKASFSFHDNTFSKIARAIAALANNSGGYVFCGVEDKTGRVRGLADADLFACDLARWSQVLRDCLMPMPIFERLLVEVAGAMVGVIYVEAASHKPIVATKTFGEKIRSGGIYYRYPGQSTEIAYGELACLLSDRDRRSQQGLLKTFNIYAERTPDEVALIDLKGGRLVSNEQPIELSKDLIDRLNVIRKGEFVEEGGAPAVRVVAEATVKATANDIAAQVVRGYVSDRAAIRNFVHRQTVEEPLQYFLAAVNSSSDWLPLFRWAREAGLTASQAVAIVEGESLTPAKRQRALERLSGKRTALLQVTRSVRVSRNRILSGDIPAIGSATDLRRLMLAIRMVEYADSEKLGHLWAALGRGFDFAWAAGNGGDLQSYVKAAAARVDELNEARAQKVAEAA